MSHKFYNWARVQRAGGIAPKSLLLVLADHANPEGICWPGITLLATTLECDERTIRRNLDKLFKADLVLRLNNGNQSKRTTYLLAPYGPFQEIKEELSELDILPTSENSELDILPASEGYDGKVNWTFCPGEVDISPRAYSIKEPSMNHQKDIKTPTPPEIQVAVVLQKKQEFFLSFCDIWEKTVPNKKSNSFEDFTWWELDQFIYFSNDCEIWPSDPRFTNLISSASRKDNPISYFLKLLENGRLTEQPKYDPIKRKARYI